MSVYNANKYSDTAINTFEILGGYIVDIFYNHIYEKAKAVHVSKTDTIKSVTDAYRIVGKTYLMQFKKPDLYKQTVLDIYKYFCAWNRNISFSYVDWINNVTKEFIPTDYFASVTPSRREHVLGTILEGAVVEFANYMFQPVQMTMVIDNHTDKSNVHKLQDKMVSIMMEQHESMYLRFLKPTIGKGTSNAGDKLSDKLKTELQRITKENMLLRTKLKKAAEMVKEYAQKASVMEQKIEYLIDRARSQKEELDELHANQPQQTAILAERPSPNLSPKTSPYVEKPKEVKEPPKEVKEMGGGAGKPRPRRATAKKPEPVKVAVPNDDVDLPSPIDLPEDPVLAAKAAAKVKQSNVVESRDNLDNDETLFDL